MTCEYNLSFYIYENKKMNSYLQKKMAIGFIQKLSRRQKTANFSEKN